MSELVQALVQQGGFAVLAGFALVLLYKQGEQRATDLKAAAEREKDSRTSVEELHRETLQVISGIREALAALTGRVESIDRRRPPR